MSQSIWNSRVSLTRWSSKSTKSILTSDENKENALPTIETHRALSISRTFSIKRLPAFKPSQKENQTGSRRPHHGQKERAGSFNALKEQISAPTAQFHAWTLLDAFNNTPPPPPLLSSADQAKTESVVSIKASEGDLRHVDMYSTMWDEPIPLNRTIMQDSKTAYEENRHAALREAYSPNVTLDWLADDVSAGAVMTAKAMADKLGKAAADIPGSSSDDSLTVDADTSMTSEDIAEFSSIGEEIMETMGERALLAGSPGLLLVITDPSTSTHRPPSQSMPSKGPIVCSSSPLPSSAMRPPPSTSVHDLAHPFPSWNPSRLSRTQPAVACQSASFVSRLNLARAAASLNCIAEAPLNEEEDKSLSLQLENTFAPMSRSVSPASLVGELSFTLGSTSALQKDSAGGSFYQAGNLSSGSISIILQGHQVTSRLATLPAWRLDEYQPASIVGSAPRPHTILVTPALRRLRGAPNRTVRWAETELGPTGSTYVRPSDEEDSSSDEKDSSSDEEEIRIVEEVRGCNCACLSIVPRLDTLPENPKSPPSSSEHPHPRNKVDGQRSPN